MYEFFWRRKLSQRNKFSKTSVEVSTFVNLALSYFLSYHLALWLYWLIFVIVPTDCTCYLLFLYYICSGLLSLLLLLLCIINDVPKDLE